MSRVDTKTHHQRNESSSSNTLHPSDIPADIAPPSVQSNQPSYPHTSPPPRRRPRGNTFGMPGPDTGKIPTLFAPTDKSRLGVTPEPQSAAKQHQEKEDEPVPEDDHDDEDPEDVMEGSHNEEHTFGIKMPHLGIGRRARADSYASIMSNYSNTRGRDDGSAQGIDSHHHPSTADGSFMHINRSRSSLYTTGGAISPLDRSFYERDDQDRSSMLTTSTTLNFTHDWSINEPRGSIATLTFGAGFGESSSSAPAYTTRRISVVDGGAGIAGTSESEDGVGVAGIGTTANKTPMTTGTFTSVPASVDGSGADGGAGLRSGVSPSPTTSLLQSSSHGHNNATYKNPALSRNSLLLFSHQHHSPRPSIDSLRSNHTLLGVSKLADKPNSEEEHTKYSGVQPSGPSTRMGADTRATISMGVGGSSVRPATTTARINDTNLYRNDIHSATAISSTPSSPSLLGRQRRPRPLRPSQHADIALAHEIHRSDSLEKLDTKRRSTVSSTGSASTSFFDGITSVFHISNNSNNSGAGTTPGDVVRRPKSSTTGAGSGGNGGVSRLAIGVSQQDRWERERERQKGVVKGKEKETEYSHDNKPSKDTLLHHQPYHQRPKPISIPSDSPSVVSPNGSIFIESFSSPVEDIDGVFGLEAQGDPRKTGQEAASSFHSVPDSTYIQHDPAHFQMSASGPLALATPSTIAVENLVNEESSGRFNPSLILTRSKDRREHYILGPHQEILRGRESDGKAGDGTDADKDKEDQERDTAVPTTTTELLSSLSPASSRSNHYFHNHGRLLLNGVDDTEDETIIRRQTHGHRSDLHNAVQSHTLSNANVDSSSKPSTTIYSGPTFSSPNNTTLSRRPSAGTPDSPSDLSKFTFPSPFLSFATAPTPVPRSATNPATRAPVSASPTRRLLHSFSQPSLSLSAQSQVPHPPSKLQLDKVYRPPPQPSPAPSSVAAKQDLVQTDPHPYAMYSPGSRYHHPETTTNASVVANTNQIPTVLSANTTHADKKSAHPYSNAYQRSIQMQDTSVRICHPTVLQSRLITTTSGITTSSSNDETVKFQAMSNPHGLKRTLRSSFKLPRSSTPNSAAVHSLSGVVSPNPKTLNATTAGYASTGGNSRSSIRSSVSMPNLRSLFKFGQSHDNNKSHARDDVIRSANAKGKTSSAVAALQPTTPKKARRLKTQYTAETWCDALLFPRPRFRAHVTSPPPSPIHVSALGSANGQNDTYPPSQSSPGSLDWAVPVTGASSPNLAQDTLPQSRTPPRESRFVADSSYPPRVVPPPPKLKAPPKGKPRKNVIEPVLPSLNLEADTADVDPQPMLSTLEQVLIEGEIRNREREQWSGIAKSSFQNRRSRSLSRSRKRAGTTTSTLTSSSAAPSSFEHHGRGRGRTRNHSDADRKSDERTMTHGTANSISRSLAAGLTTIAVEAFRQPTPTISTVSHHGGHGTGENHYQTATMTTDTHSNGYHSRTTSESGPAGQRHGHGSSHTRNTSWGKAALKTLCGSASEDEEASRHRLSEEDGAGTVTVARGRPTAAHISEKRQDSEQQLHPRVVNPTTSRPRGTPHIYGQKVNFDLANVPAAAVTHPPVPIPSTAAAERSLSPNSNTSELAEIVIAVSTPPPQSAVPNDSVIDLSTHPYAQFPASAPYAGPHPSSRDYKPLYTPRHNNFSHRLQPSSNPEVHATTTFGHSQVSPTFTASIRPHDADLQPSSRKETDPTPYAYANVGESNKRESKLSVEEALISTSFRGFSDAILEDESNVLADVKTPKHSPRSFVDTEEEEQKYHYAVLNETSASPNIAPSRSTQVYGKAQYVQSLPQDPNTTTMSSPSSQNSSYSWMSRPLGAVDDLDQFRDLFFRRPHNSPGTVTNVAVFDSNDDFGFYQRSPITSSSQFLGTPGSPPQSPVQRMSANDREQRLLEGSVEVDYVVPQDFPEDIESSRASSVIEPDTFVEDTLRLGIVPLSVPITTESIEQRHSTTPSFVDTHNHDTVMSTASAYSVPSVNKDNELRQSFVTNDSSTSGVAKLLGNFPSPPPPTRINNSRPDSYHVLGLAESRHIMTPASSSLRT